MPTLRRPTLLMPTLLMADTTYANTSYANTAYANAAYANTSYDSYRNTRQCSRPRHTYMPTLFTANTNYGRHYLCSTLLLANNTAYGQHCLWPTLLLCVMCMEIAIVLCMRQISLRYLWGLQPLGYFKLYWSYV